MGRMRSVAEIATVERAVAKKIYPAGTTLIRMSAVKGFVEESVFKYVEEPGPIESMYCCIVPNEDMIRPRVMHELIGTVLDEYMHTYVSGMNIQAKDFRFLEIPVAPMAEQVELEKQLNRLDQEEKETRKLIAALKKFKAVMLDDMFVKSDPYDE